MSMNNRKISRPLIVSVEAAIASGKSTLLNLVGDRMGNDVYVVQEPVMEWQKIEGAEEHNLLDLFYKDMDRWAFSFQAYVLFTIIRSVQNAVDVLEKEGRLDDTVILVERSYDTSKETFARMLHESGHIGEHEWSMYKGWYDWMVEKAPPFSGSIYMRAELETVMERLDKRNRGEESGITPEYQARLIQRHEDWVDEQLEKGASVLILDAEADFLSNEDALDLILGQITEFFEELRSEAPPTPATICPPTPETICPPIP
eukprot:GEMP01001830.1.p2 GENE.GEMP01001830.1~~GEMP01001830.1.p2  ORF type:complete len:259 (-),score=54.77 GEMP01001830.1:1377-2153(-)